MYYKEPSKLYQFFLNVIIRLALLMVVAVIALPIYLIFFDHGQKIELDTSRLEEYGMVRLRCPDSLLLWKEAEEGQLEIARSEGASWDETLWPDQWHYITLTDGCGKYTFSLRGADQDKQTAPVAKKRLEVTALPSLENVNGWENVQFIVDEDRGILVRRIFDKEASGLDEVFCIQKDEEGAFEYAYALGETGKWEVIPITEGSGSYLITVSFGPDLLTSGHREQDVYATFDITLSDPNISFLTPSTVIRYTENSDCVAIASQLVQGLETDQEKIAAIVAYVSDHITYDEALAESRRNENSFVKRALDADQILRRGSGTCSDYTTLATAMLRSQGFPCKYVSGEVEFSPGDVSYHAWIEVQVGEDQWERLDPTNVAVLRGLPEDDKETRERVKRIMRDDGSYRALCYY